MNIAKIALAPFALALFALPTISSAQTVNRVEIGVLDCEVQGGSGFIIGSTKQLNCVFDPAGSGRPTEAYDGTIYKYGIDIGETTSGVISWAVFAPTRDFAAPGALAGRYGGASAEITAGAGLGANVLFGGSRKTIALQPVSVSTQTGLNFALAISELQLAAASD